MNNLNKIRSLRYGLFFTMVFLLVSVLYGQQNVTSFSAILADIDSWKNKPVVMDLRLKQVNYLFKTITFYDSDNIDIEFPFKEKKKREELAGDLLNAHNGILYHVKFTILGGGNIEGLLGDLHEFKPVAGDRLPEPQ